MGGYTKGPWEAVQLAEGKFSIFTPAFPYRDALVVLDSSQDVHEGYRTIETPANAKLIAAAPEIYEALKLAEDALRTSYNVADYPADGESKQDIALASARAAIAKAEGK